MDGEENKKIGKIVGSNSHIDYTCEVYREKDREDPPSPSDYRFGEFVYIEKEIDGRNLELIGVIYDSKIVDPDQGRSGPRLAEPEEQELFHPSYVEEKMTLTGIALLGYCELDGGEYGSIEHCVPPWTLEVDDIVKKLPEESMLEFHGGDGNIQLGYYQNLMGVAESFGRDLLSNIIDQLKEMKPEEKKTLDVLQKNLEFKKRVEGV